MSKAPRVAPALVFRDPGHLLAFGLGLGLAPVAPGTFGTLLGAPVAAALARLGPAGAAFGTALLFAAGVWLCDRSARALGVDDHPGIVWDEVVGYAIALLFVPSAWGWWLAAFLLFRALDIVKPWPIREIDHSLRGGLGTMLDDAVAGLLTGLALLLARLLFLNGPS
jgi:phosphatidylglycerophosphatase A